MRKYINGRVCIIVAVCSGICAGVSDRPMIAGRLNSLVKVLIYEDLQCPDCADFQTMMDRQVLPRYGDRVGFVYRDFPLVYHNWAVRAAIASRFISEKNMQLGLEYRRWIMSSQDETTLENFDHRLQWFATKNHIDPQEAVKALDSSHYRALVVKDLKDGLLSGVKHTPTVIVDGKWFVEKISFDDLAKAIDAALTKVASRKLN
jgi:protein-disulfide isomerase